MAEYLTHLLAFRDRMDVTYPFAVVEGDVIGKDYHVRGIPTLVFVDADGTIGYVQVGSGGHALLARAVKSRPRQTPRRQQRVGTGLRVRPCIGARTAFPGRLGTRRLP